MIAPLTDEEKSTRPLTLEEAQEYLRVGRNVMLRLFQNGEVQARKVGREWRTTKAALDDYMRGE
ncbi:hypothetical protein SDC9_84732 [bioreactor metagenome]|uniref:DNA binding domain-containing protein (Modular protein) n=2 Tax=root TaxID=1 RepID=A0A212JRU3_9BACT|nr:helix-turn-helix domain-containing protein [Desulfovibrio desulfuricans]MCB6541354.1 helix-turn-helix domain-containing protein [Desulfovibrio desulfuricans]MCB6552436.1 helix-turn-helix domain-containing protein [Desulfovibrio desulfuricans]MCB6564317.1 helix-turn-helix domain-containing protein [Desulfovibrio desulfuricans]MCB7345459.1 helix-turn-helix domain-containing protein [Desulfovibrio desulfuricans]MCQ4860861.1 helix-turn-helix domain-containing protein [Desulfovibrio desulfurican